MPRQLDREFHVFAATCGRDILAILIGCENLFEQRTELDLAPRSACLNVCQDAFRSPTPAAKDCISPSPLYTCSRRSLTCLKDSPSRVSRVP